MYGASIMDGRVSVVPEQSLVKDQPDKQLNESFGVDVQYGVCDTEYFYFASTNPK